MRLFLKPYAFPTIILLLELGFDMSGFHSDWWGGLLIGIALFWALFALFNNKPLLRKYPGILEWAPFLDFTEGFSRAEQLTGKYISGQTFNLSAIVHDGAIKDKTFNDCDIYGPAVIFIEGVFTFHECTFDGKPEEIFIGVDQKSIVGPIHVLNGAFRKCRLHKIGIIGNKEDTQKLIRDASNV